MINKEDSIVRFYILLTLSSMVTYLVLYVFDGNIAIFPSHITSLYLSEGLFSQ